MPNVLLRWLARTLRNANASANEDVGKPVSGKPVSLAAAARARSQPLAVKKRCQFRVADVAEPPTSRGSPRGHAASSSATTGDSLIATSLCFNIREFSTLEGKSRRTTPTIFGACNRMVVLSRKLALFTVLLLLSCVFSTHGFSATTAPGAKRQQQPVTTEDAEEIRARQSIGEEKARSGHDNFSMNALFVNVDERPEPVRCTVAPGSDRLPTDLPSGALLRIGPNGATTDEGFLDGDGMVHCVVIPLDREKDVTYSSTYLETKGRSLERRKGDGSRFGGTLGAAPRGLPMLGNLVKNGLTFGTADMQKDTCNTAMAISGDRLLALMEQSPPTEFRVSRTGKVETVESFTRLDGAVPPAPINGGSLGAHGRTDPGTGERVHVSYDSNDRPYVRVDTFDAGWRLKGSVGVDVPAPVMVHDSALTEGYVVILDFPLTIRPRRLLANSFPVEYEPQHGARIGLVPRSGGGETMWFDVESGVVLHAANAHEDGDGNVIVHGFKSVPRDDASYILEYTPAFLYEWVLDPSTGKTIDERCLNPDVLVEFPIVEDSVVGKKTDAVYGLVTTSIGGPLLQFSTPQSAVLLDAVIKFALEDGEVHSKGDVAGRYDLPVGWHMVSEPTVLSKTSGEGTLTSLLMLATLQVLLLATFVPPPEEEGIDHVGVAKDGISLRTELLVLDGDSLDGGPVAKVDLPSHVNYGLHSLFVDWERIKD
ncbi:hypothetical protein THAOC_06792 [Thalassiosira oceanica]|uniref:Carotenoid oxygenase n=1 Tax=Thalassiosira oceanica TaxID=159749 RepID=K0TE74_THAOC|nr:hypothetical protein THAOC_06792 [Thalassiosira oceanica]|eukprot:EJK71741.1 hypothetical protein THAOC_06792 [Thalassiosira oceanica]